MSKKENRAFKLLATIALIVILCMTLAVPAFAKGVYKNYVYTVADGTTEINDKTVEPVYKYLVQKLIIPSSVTEIKPGAFKGFNSWYFKMVLVKGRYNDEKIIVPDVYAKYIVYELGERPTKPVVDEEPVTKPPAEVPTTTATTTTAPAAEKKVEPVTKKAPPAVRKKKNTAKVVAAIEPTIEEPITEVVVMDKTPFAEAKEQLENMSVWEQLINQPTDVEQPVQKENITAKAVSYVTVVFAAISGLALTVIKFKK
ncbi:MAG: hypothetical protein GX241_05610 [Ruminococcaceae bacterium]|nr:hypothetical protein [Oscillospiraceae bacterium]